ncbi:hypothetical protein ANCCEY_04295 [Ancylostoma ceylanicum]|uniref:Uncharacterized protein n=1 Tax=Ancylostoma ceylanicum TaxID=53326 RepID=A0A0D6M2N8_9BILA|nr:hypothetical protein ANCCEY_04295 [Ancylostoma ceylanicum]
MDSHEKSLSWLDYAIFAASLSLSIGTGVYHAIRSRFLLKSGQAKTSAKDEYLMGGHIGGSIAGSVTGSADTSHGSTGPGIGGSVDGSMGGSVGVQIWLNFVVGTLSSVITCIVFLPIFGLCTTLYTCIGGLKAVVWSDSLQAILMYSGVLTLIVQGLRHPRVGGFGRVWSIAVESGRTSELFRFDPRIDQYNSVWINLVSGTITWLASFGVNQLAIQRYASLPTLQQAQGEDDEIIALGLYSVFWRKCLQVELAITTTFFFGRECDS